MKQQPIYRVRDWNTHFENAHSRKCKILHWVRIPNQHDGAGYGRVAQHPRCCEVFAAWVLMLEVASKCEPRGVLVKGETGLDAEDLAMRTRFPAEVFELAFEVLTDPRIGWLERCDNGVEGIPF